MKKFVVSFTDEEFFNMICIIDCFRYVYKLNKEDSEYDLFDSAKLREKIVKTRRERQ